MLTFPRCPAFLLTKTHIVSPSLLFCFSISFSSYCPLSFHFPYFSTVAHKGNKDIFVTNRYSDFRDGEPNFSETVGRFRRGMLCFYGIKMTRSQVGQRCELPSFRNFRRLPAHPPLQFKAGRKELNLSNLRKQTPALVRKGIHICHKNKVKQNIRVSLGGTVCDSYDNHRSRTLYQRFSVPKTKRKSTLQPLAKSYFDLSAQAVFHFRINV